MIKLIFNRKVKKVPFILQMETCECGAASLAMILAYFGKWITLEQAREICGVSRDGVNIKNILKAAISYGLEVEKKTYSTKEFQESNQFPCIVKLKNNKFIVVNGFNKNIFDVNDPSKGNIKINIEEFKKIFSGDCLYLYPSEKFEPSGKPRNILEFIKYRL